MTDGHGDADQQHVPVEPSQQTPLGRSADTDRAVGYGATSVLNTAASTALTPVDEEQQSRHQQSERPSVESTSTPYGPPGHGTHDTAYASDQPSQSLATALEQAEAAVLSSSAPTSMGVYQISPPLTPPPTARTSTSASTSNSAQVMPNSPKMYAGHVSSVAAGAGQAHVSYQPISGVGGAITPPRSSSARRGKSSRKSSKGKSRSPKGKSKSKSSSRGSSASAAASRQIMREQPAGAEPSGVASSIKRSLSNLSLLINDETDSIDEEASHSTSRSLRFGIGSYQEDDDLTTAHHRAELYGQIGGPTGMIGALGDRRGCKRLLVLITLAFILLSMVVQSIGGAPNEDTEAGKDIEAPTEEARSQEDALVSGKCRQIIDKQAIDLEDAKAKNVELEKEVRKLQEAITDLMQTRAQGNWQGG